MISVPEYISWLYHVYSRVVPQLPVLAKDFFELVLNEAAPAECEQFLMLTTNDPEAKKPPVFYVPHSFRNVDLYQTEGLERFLKRHESLFSLEYTHRKKKYTHTTFLLRWLCFYMWSFTCFGSLLQKMDREEDVSFLFGDHYLSGLKYATQFHLQVIREVVLMHHENNLMGEVDLECLKSNQIPLPHPCLYVGDTEFIAGIYLLNTNTIIHEDEPGWLFDLEMYQRYGTLPIDRTFQ